MRVSNGELSSGHARAIVGVSGKAAQIKIAEKIVKEGLSVRETEKLIKEADAPAKRPAKRKAEKNADVKRVEEDLKAVLGTRVNLAQSGKKGKIEIEYYSREELERLIELLKTLG